MLTALIGKINLANNQFSESIFEPNRLKAKNSLTKLSSGLQIMDKFRETRIDHRKSGRKG